MPAKGGDGGLEGGAGNSMRILFSFYLLILSKHEALVIFILHFDYVIITALSSARPHRFLLTDLQHGLNVY